jgi:hypothetical protein
VIAAVNLVSSKIGTDASYNTHPLLRIIRPSAWLWLLCANVAHGATVQKLIDGARRERQLVLYSSLILGEANVLLPRFEAKYPS